MSSDRRKQIATAFRDVATDVRLKKADNMFNSGRGILAEANGMMGVLKSGRGIANYASASEVAQARERNDEYVLFSECSLIVVIPSPLCRLNETKRVLLATRHEANHSAVNTLNRVAAVTHFHRDASIHHRRVKVIHDIRHNVHVIQTLTLFILEIIG